MTGESRSHAGDEPPADHPAGALARYESEVARHYRWNVAVYLAYGLLGTTGWRLIMAPTFVPDYLFRLSGSNLMVGALLFAGGLARFLSPLVGAARVAHRLLVKRTAIRIGTAMRVQVLGMALAALLLPTRFNLLVYELAERGELGIRIAVVNAVGELLGAIAPRAGGAIADRWSYPALYAVASAFRVLALTTMLLGVRPRRVEAR